MIDAIDTLQFSFRSSIYMIDRALFQIFRRYFLRNVWLLNIVPYVSESRTLSVLSSTFGLGICGIIMTSSEPYKLVLMP